MKLKAILSSLVAVAAIGLSACNDPIDPAKALIGTVITSSLYPGDTVDYRVSNMSREIALYDLCQVPRLQSINTTSGAWVTSTTLPTLPDEPCSQVSIDPWESVESFVVIPASLAAGTYRMMLINDPDGSDTSVIATPFYTNSFTIVALPTTPAI